MARSVALAVLLVCAVTSASACFATHDESLGEVVTHASEHADASHDAAPPMEDDLVLDAAWPAATGDLDAGLPVVELDAGHDTNDASDASDAHDAAPDARSECREPWELWEPWECRG